METFPPKGRDAVQQVAVARMAFGVAGLVAPRLLGRIWIGPEGGSGRVAIITRAFAVRDLALGLGAFLAARRNAPVRGWVEAGLLCDIGDTVGALAGGMGGPKTVMLLAASMSGVAGGALSMQGLERSAG